MSWTVPTGITFVYGGMAVRGQELYACAGNSIERVSLAGTNQTTYVGDGLYQTKFMTVHSNILYISHTDSSGLDTIKAIDPVAAVTDFFSSSLVGANLNMLGLASHNGYLYVATRSNASGSIIKISLTDPEIDYSSWVEDPILSNASALCIANGSIYVACGQGSGGNIAQINIATQSVTSIASFSNDLWPAAIATDGTYLYVSVNGTTTADQTYILSLTGSILHTTYGGVIDSLGLMIHGQYLYGATELGSILRFHLPWSAGYNWDELSFAILGSNLYSLTNGPMTKTNLATGLVTDSNFVSSSIYGNGSGRCIDTYNNTIYVLNFNPISASDPATIYKITLSGVATPYFNNTIAGSTVNLEYSENITFDGGNLYLANRPGSNIVRVSLTTPTDFDDAWVEDSLLTGTRSLCIAGGFMYANGSSNILKINMSSKAVSILAPISSDFIATDGKVLYVTDNANAYIQRMSFDGTVINSNFATVPDLPQRIVINDLYMYAGVSGGIIYRYPIPWSTGHPYDNIAIAILGNNMYSTSGGGLSKTNLANGIISDSNWASFPSSFPYAAIAGSNSIYSIMQSGDIYTISASGTVTSFFNTIFANGSIESLAIYNGYLYIPQNGKITQISLTNASNYTEDWLQSSFISNGADICIANGFMYIVTENELAKVNMTTKVLTNLGYVYTSKIATDGNVLYTVSAGRVSYIKVVSFDGTVLNDRYAQLPNVLASIGPLTVNGSYLYAGAYYAGLDESAYSIAGSVFRFPLYVAQGPVICFKEGTLILTDKGYLPIEGLRKGDLVKTLLHGYKPIYMIGKKEIYHPASTERGKDQLYIGTQAEFPVLKEDLIITGSHCILVDEFKEGEEEETIKVLGKIYATDDKYRLPACVDKRFAVYKPEGKYTIYHLALEHENRLMNYGIFANGLLVETCSKRCMDEYGQMDII